MLMHALEGTAGVNKRRLPNKRSGYLVGWFTTRFGCADHVIRSPQCGITDHG